MIATGSHRDRIKQAMLQAMQEGRKVDYQDIASSAQVGYSTVKKYAPEIRLEIASSSQQEHTKLELAIQALRENPTITDEELAPLLGLRRAASARFWRLKAREIVQRGS